MKKKKGKRKREKKKGKETNMDRCSIDEQMTAKLINVLKMKPRCLSKYDFRSKAKTCNCDTARRSQSRRRHGRRRLNSRHF